MRRKKRLKDMSARQAARLQSETIEERQMRLQDMSARQAARLQLETSDKKQMRLKVKRTLSNRKIGSPCMHDHIASIIAMLQIYTVRNY